MQKKTRMRKMVIWSVSVIVALMVASMLTGNEKKETIIVVGGELDVSQPLDAQKNSFRPIEITKSESDKLGDSVVRNFNELKGKKIPFALGKGSPIPTALLSADRVSGQFATSTEEYHTYYLFQGGTALLPPGVTEGDLIDVSLMYQDGEMTALNTLMESVEVALIQENNLYVKVSQSGFNLLTVASQTGQFILQLPGQKAIEHCANLNEEEFANSDCYDDFDKPVKITQDDVLRILKDPNSNINEILKDRVEITTFEEEPDVQEKVTGAEDLQGQFENDITIDENVEKEVEKENTTWNKPSTEQQVEEVERSEQEKVQEDIQSDIDQRTNQDAMIGEF